MLHRYPEGVGSSEKIYQKRLPKGAPDWAETAEVSFPSGRTADELCVTELAAVAWAVQMSTVEFHPWHTEVVTLDGVVGVVSPRASSARRRCRRSGGQPEWP